VATGAVFQQNPNSLVISKPEKLKWAYNMLNRTLNPNTTNEQNLTHVSWLTDKADGPTVRSGCSSTWFDWRWSRQWRIYHP